MPYRTILVCLTNPERVPGILDVAVPIAVANDAHLVGLYVVPQVEIYSAVAVQITTEMLEAHRQYHLERAAEIESLFEKRLDREDVGREWRTVDAPGSMISDTAVQHALSADLVIVGQADPENDPQDATDLQERLLMNTGRPVLFVPYAGSFPSVGKNVLIAWNATKEAARAAFDAIPLMSNAEKIGILSINVSDEGERAIPPGGELAVALSRHGLRSEASQSFPQDISAGDELLSRAADFGADLLVMGGYGHSRLREIVFGGVTRHVLRHMTVPVLMSH